MKHRFVAALVLSLIVLASLIAACGGPASAVPTESIRSDPPGSVSEGRKVFVAQGCGSCHKAGSLAEATGTSGPDLSNFGGRTNMRVVENREELATFIKDPTSRKPDSKMPKSNLSNDQVRDLVAFLASLKGQ